MTLRMYLPVLLFFVVAATQGGAPPQLAASRECSPCRLKTQGTAGGLQELAVWLKPVPTASGGRRAESLQLQSAEAGEVRLPVTPGMDIRPRQNFILDASDIDFDGVGDLMLVVSAGTSNVSAQYWVFDSRANKYVEVGVYPELRVDLTAHQLTSHEDDGEAGQLYRDSVYAWRERKLVKIRETRQEWTGTPARLMRITSEPREGHLAVISRTPVPKPNK